MKEIYSSFLLISFILIQLSRGVPWDPKVDECRSALIGYNCRATINGDRQINANAMAREIRQIEAKTRRKRLAEVFSRRNTSERKYIELSYDGAHRTPLYNKMRKNRIYFNKPRHYNQFYKDLMNPVAEQYAHYLTHAAKHVDDVDLDDRCQMIISIIAGLSNAGLAEVHQYIKAKNKGRDYDKVLKRSYYRYNDGFTKIVQVIFRAERDEQPGVLANEYNEDYNGLNLHIGSARGSNDDQSEALAFFLLILRSRHFSQLQQLFNQFNHENPRRPFEVQLSRFNLDSQIINAVRDMYYVVMNRPKHYAHLLHGNNYIKFLVTLIISRSEIDLENIKDEYLNEYDKAIVQDGIRIFTIDMDYSVYRTVMKILRQNPDSQAQVNAQIGQDADDSSSRDSDGNNGSGGQNQAGPSEGQAQGGDDEEEEGDDDDDDEDEEEDDE